MPQIRSILTATDFSSYSKYAAERAAMLGSSLKVPEATLLHVIDRSWLDNLNLPKTVSEIQDRIAEAALRSLRRTSRQLERCTGSVLKPRVLAGNTLQSISDLSSEFDLLVLGAHGRHRFRALVLGTTSQRVLSKTKRPVLIVKRKPVEPYQRVMVAIDFSSNSAKALNYSCVVAPDALLFLVHVFEPIFEFHAKTFGGISDEELAKHRSQARLEVEAELARFVASAGVNPDKPLKLVEHGRAPEKLSEMFQKWNPDLIIIGKHGRSRLEEFLLGSVTMHVLSESKCDVLVAQ